MKLAYFCVNDRAVLQIEIPGSFWIENLELTAFLLITEELYQF
jgi:hypothetical protein